MDCTEIGAPPPTGTGPTDDTAGFAARVQRTFADGGFTGLAERLFDFWHRQ